MMVINHKTHKLLNVSNHSVPLAILRMAFGFLMTFSMLRFLFNGWIEKAYTTPQFHFTYQYFDWIQPFDTNAMYGIVISCAIASFCIGLGLFYRIATVYFFISFTYLELIEKSWYLNHYYLVSIIAFLLIIVPAHQFLSLDVRLRNTIKKQFIPAWWSFVFKLQLSIVYFYGGIAKLNSDWLLEAQPMSIWIKAKTDLPLIGSLLEYDTTAFIFSWAGLLYDLCIPFLLWNKKTRPVAFVLVITFHVLTHILFNIGMFPWIMIGMSLIFITKEEWNAFSKKIGYTNPISIDNNQKVKLKTYAFGKAILIPFFTIQLLFPLRHFLLTDNVLWTENGFRFSWQVMVMEKTGYTAFTVKDKKSGKQWKEYPSRRLSVIQEKQMNFQPDMIWQYAQYLKKIYQKKGIENPEIYVNSRVALNGRPSQVFISDDINLVSLKDINEVYDLILPLQ